MFITVLAYILLTLGIAALAAIIIKVVCFTAKMLFGKIKEKLKAKFGGKIAVTHMQRVMEEAIKQAEKDGNTTRLSELEAMINDSSIVIAQADENGTVDKEGIEIIEAVEMDETIINLLNEQKDGLLTVTA